MVGESSARPSVRRNLFGTVDRSETDEYLNQLHEQQKVAASQKWNFDFRSGQPMTGSNRYTWEQVNDQEYVPPAYGECALASTTAKCDDCDPQVLSASGGLPVTSSDQGEASVRLPVTFTDKADDAFKTDEAVLNEDKTVQLQANGTEVLSNETVPSGC